MKNALIVTCNDSYDYNTRTRYVEQVLKESGYSVEHLLSDFDHRNKKTYHATREGIINYVHVTFYKKNISLQRLWSHIRFGQQVKKYVMNSNYDLVYHCAPPNYTIKELCKCKEKKSFKLITEVGDMWPESIPVGEKVRKLFFVPFRMWSKLRDQYLFNSDMVIAECDLFRDTIQRKSGISNIQTLYFCKEFTGENRTINYMLGHEISLCYLGSINNIIDIEMIGKIIKALKKNIPVKLHIIGDGENRQYLIETAEQSGASVEFYGSIYDEDKKKQIFNQCHYALNIMKPEVFVGMTMKSLDYFSAGLPMINNIGGDIWKMVDEEKVGYNINLDLFDESIDKIITTVDEEYRRILRNVSIAHEKHFSIQRFKEQMKKIVR